MLSTIGSTFLLDGSLLFNHLSDVGLDLTELSFTGKIGLEVLNGLLQHLIIPVVDHMGDVEVGGVSIICAETILACVNAGRLEVCPEVLKVARAEVAKRCVVSKNGKGRRGWKTQSVMFVSVMVKVDRAKATFEGDERTWTRSSTTEVGGSSCSIGALENQEGYWRSMSWFRCLDDSSAGGRELFGLYEGQLWDDHPVRAHN